MKWTHKHRFIMRHDTIIIIGNKTRRATIIIENKISNSILNKGLKQLCFSLNDINDGKKLRGV